MPWPTTVQSAGSSPFGSDVDVIQFAVGLGTTSSVTAIPLGAQVHRCQIDVGTAYSLGTTLRVGDAATPDLIMQVADVNPQLVDAYIEIQNRDWPTGGVVVCTVVGAPVVGACVVTVEFSEPLS